MPVLKLLRSRVVSLETIISNTPQAGFSFGESGSGFAATSDDAGRIPFGRSHQHVGGSAAMKS
jgi:hypothetical protein